MRKQMTYRTGEITPKRIDQEYPRQIEISIPSGGLGTRLNDHHEFCRSRRLRYATRGIGKVRRIEERDAVRYCFKNACDAYAFQAAFGGERRVAPAAEKSPAPSIGRDGLWSKRRT